MSNIMPDVENWQGYGFPDDIMFRTPYLPWVGIIKALNERLAAMNQTPMDLPEYFTKYGGMIWASDYSNAFGRLFPWSPWGKSLYYVNPDKISSATRYRDCFWDRGDLEQAALNGEFLINVTSFMRPKYSVKWAKWQYNQINLLRYVVTSEYDDWPDVFTYIDINSSFNFKAPEP